MTTTTAIPTPPTFKVLCISERCLREEFFVREKEEKKKISKIY
jgi:hypothetical protein